MGRPEFKEIKDYDELCKYYNVICAMEKTESSFIKMKTA